MATGGPAIPEGAPTPKGGAERQGTTRKEAFRAKAKALQRVLRNKRFLKRVRPTGPVTEGTAHRDLQRIAGQESVTEESGSVGSQEAQSVRVPVEQAREAAPRGGEPQPGSVEAGVVATVLPPAEVIPVQTEREVVEHKMQAALEGNEDYRKQKQKLDSDEFRDQRNIDAMVTPQQPGESDDAYAARQDKQDAKITGLSGADKKKYEDYVTLRERAKATEVKAQYSAEKEAIDNLPEGPVKDKKLSDLESWYRESLEEGILATDFNYQRQRRAHRRTERSLASLTDRDGRRVFSDDVIRFRDPNERMSWDDVKDLSIGGKKIFPNETAFKQFRNDREDMTAAEDQASGKVSSRRMEQDIGPDGKTKNEKEKQALLEEEVSRQAPGMGKFRRGMRKLGMTIEHWFSKAEKNDHKKKAFGYLKRLNDYGLVRGLFAQWALPKDKRAMAKTLRKLFLRESGAYMSATLKRGALFYALLSFALFFLTPVVMAKGIDMVKPFGKS